MTTTAALIEATRRWLQASDRPEHNRLTNSETNADTSIQFDFALGAIVPGAILGVELEEMRVWSVSSPSATVQRGWNGSTAASHLAGTIVEVNPLFSSWRIFNELNGELNALSGPLYQIKTVTTTTSAAFSYNLAADVQDILAVQYNDFGSTLDWPLLRRWDFLANQDTTVFASGKALRLFEAPVSGRTLRVTYAANLGQLTGLTDNVETLTGLPASAIDIPAIGAAARLLASREARRSQLDMQPEPRQAADVPPGAARTASSQLFALRDRRLREEAGKLTRLYPKMTKRAAAV